MFWNIFLGNAYLCLRSLRVEIPYFFPYRHKVPKFWCKCAKRFVVINLSAFVGLNI